MVTGASLGQQAKCCIIPVAGQDLLCQDPNGSSGDQACMCASHESRVVIALPVLGSGTYGNAQCCATDVLGVADLNCNNPQYTSRRK